LKLDRKVRRTDHRPERVTFRGRLSGWVTSVGQAAAPTGQACPE
jgi:hypothetical protein